MTMTESYATEFEYGVFLAQRGEPLHEVMHDSLGLGGWAAGTNQRVSLEFMEGFCFLAGYCHGFVDPATLERTGMDVTDLNELPN
jgi:hypothetical protein